MAYEPTLWKDRAVERPRTYAIQNNPDGTITLIPAPGAIAEPGTPVNAANLNKIEQGVADAHTDVAKKVDKPASATSGNIAVFDGGAGKLKDSGKTIGIAFDFGYAQFSFAEVPPETYTAKQYINTGSPRKAIIIFVGTYLNRGGMGLIGETGVRDSIAIGQTISGSTRSNYILTSAGESVHIVSSGPGSAENVRLFVRLLSDGRIEIQGYNLRSTVGSGTFDISWWA